MIGERIIERGQEYPGEEELEEKEDVFYWEGLAIDLVDKYPDSEEKERWGRKLDNGKEELSLGELKALVEEIEAYIRGSFGIYDDARIFEGDTEESSFVNEKDRDRIVMLVDRILSDPENFQGKGKIAVFVSDGPNGEMGFKVVTDPVAYRDGKDSLDIGQEARILSEVCDIKFPGARIPIPYYYIKYSRAHVLAMENLAGAVPIRRYIEDRGRRLPHGFDKQNFKSLEMLLLEIHKRGIAHGDIHDDNILINEKTGELYLIDFGKAKKFDVDNGERFIYTENSFADNDRRCTREIADQLFKK